MENTKELPQEEMRKQYRHQAFQQKQGTGIGTPRSSKSATEKHELDHIADSTNKWSTALKKTRNITRWLEQHRTKTIQLTWISSLQMEHELANLATKLGLDWQRHNHTTGKWWSKKHGGGDKARHPHGTD
jgi:hypothetical protein